MKKLRPILALAGTLFLFSTYEIVSKTITYMVPPLQINFWRFLFAGLLLLPVALLLNKRAGLRLNRTDIFRLSILGIVMVGLSLPLLQQAISYISASVAAVLFCTNPIFAHLFTAIKNKEMFSLRTWIGLLGSLLGMGMIIFSEITKLDFTLQTLFGIGLTLISAILFGLYLVMAKGEAEKVGSVTANAIPFIAGSLFTMPMLLWQKIPLLVFDPAAWPQMLYLTVGIACGAYLLLLYALKYLKASTGSLIFFIKPLLATLIAAWWLQEAVTPLFITGTLIVVGCLFLTNKKSAHQ